MKIEEVAEHHNESGYTEHTHGRRAVTAGEGRRAFVMPHLGFGVGVGVGGAAGVAVDAAGEDNLRRSRREGPAAGRESSDSG